MEPIQVGDVLITAEPHPEHRTVKLVMESSSQGRVEAELGNPEVRALLEALYAAALL